MIFTYIFNSNIISYECKFDRAPHVSENNGGLRYLKVVIFCKEFIVNFIANSYDLWGNVYGKLYLKLDIYTYLKVPWTSGNHVVVCLHWCPIRWIIMYNTLHKQPRSSR